MKRGSKSTKQTISKSKKSSIEFFSANESNNDNKPTIVPQPTPEISIPWVEKYRPSQFQDIVLDPLNRKIFQNMLDKKYFPHLLFYGPGGTGKTTTVINLINEYQSKYYRINKSNVIHLNASDERGIDIIRNQIHQFAKSLNLFEAGLKFVILDEVDYMTKNAQQALKYILQTCSYNVRFCLICNYITKIDESLKNEFLCIRFNQLPKQDIYQFIRNICEKEGLQLNQDMLEMVQEMYQNDIRSMINFLQLEGFRIQNMYMPFHLRILEDIDSILYCRDKPNPNDIGQTLHQISIQYNMDKRTLLEKYFNYKIKKMVDSPETNKAFIHFLKQIEIIMHRPDIPIDTCIQYLCIIANDL
jgi:replication factor C subunit 3/5